MSDSNQQYSDTNIISIININLPVHVVSGIYSDDSITVLTLLNFLSAENFLFMKFPRLRAPLRSFLIELYGLSRFPAYRGGSPNYFLCK